MCESEQGVDEKLPAMLRAARCACRGACEADVLSRSAAWWHPRSVRSLLSYRRHPPEKVTLLFVLWDFDGVVFSQSQCSEHEHRLITDGLRVVLGAILAKVFLQGNQEEEVNPLFSLVVFLI